MNTECSISLGSALRMVFCNLQDTDCTSPKSDLSNLRVSLQNITFSSGPKSYTRTSVETIQLLHYKALNLHSLQTEAPDTRGVAGQERFVDHAEFLIFYSRNEASASNDISRTSVRCMTPTPYSASLGGEISNFPTTDFHDTEISLSGDHHAVILKNVNCTGWKNNQEQNETNSLDVTIRLETPEGLLSHSKSMASNYHPKNPFTY